MVRSTASSPNLVALPIDPPTPAYPPVNGGNTCYLDAVLVALFASYDAYDALLLPAHTPLCASLVDFVNALRCGRAPSATQACEVRDALVAAGWPGAHGQQDAAELFAFLLDALRAPFVPLFSRLQHAAEPDAADNVPSTERLLWLSLGKGGGSMGVLLDDYFHGEVRRGVRRGARPVDAVVNRALLPWYTPVRETGETAGGTRQMFRYLTVPLAVGRFRSGGDGKNRAPVEVRTALPAGRYLGAFGVGAAYTLMLRSVVCHLGDTIRSGHYVAYTYEARGGWRRWNDLDGREVRAVRGDVATGLPEDVAWRREIERDCYLLFYELVPGDGEVEGVGREKGGKIERQERADAQFAAQSQQEEDQRAAFRAQLQEVNGDPKSDKLWDHKR